MTLKIGDKVIIHHTKGGPICLPVFGGSTGYDVSVDVPTILTCQIRAEEPNFFYLSWIPGANNDQVGLDVSHVAYATVPGTGIVTDKFPITSLNAKVRFQRPNTTYYICLWGIKNGAYSITSAKISVTSGGTVTPVTDPIVDPPISNDTHWVKSIVSVTYGTNSIPAYTNYILGTGNSELSTQIGNYGSITVNFSVPLKTAQRIDVYEHSSSGGGLAQVYSFDPRTTDIFNFTSLAGEQYRCTITGAYEMRIDLLNGGWNPPAGGPHNITGVYVAV